MFIVVVIWETNPHKYLRPRNLLLNKIFQNFPETNKRPKSWILTIRLLSAGRVDSSNQARLAKLLQGQSAEVSKRGVCMHVCSNWTCLLGRLSEGSCPSWVGDPLQMDWIKCRSLIAISALMFFCSFPLARPVWWDRSRELHQEPAFGRKLFSSASTISLQLARHERTPDC